MKELTQYVEQANKWNAVFKGEQFTLATPEGRLRVAQKLDSDLSPENLTVMANCPAQRLLDAIDA